MESLTVGDLRIDFAEPTERGVVRLDWHGRSNERHPEKHLMPFFLTALDHAGARAKVLELHFETLEHFNSSTIMSVIQLIQESRRREVKLVLCYEPSRRWQQLSFDALRIFDKGDGLFALEPVSAA
jgi:hypothetical protein